MYLHSVEFGLFVKKVEIIFDPSSTITCIFSSSQLKIMAQIHLINYLNKYLLSICHVPVIILGSRESMMNNLTFSVFTELIF